MSSDYRENRQLATLREALDQCGNRELNRLVRDFWVGKRPTRKDDMIGVLLQVATDQRLRELWHALGPLYKSAIAESVWSREGALNRDRFKAKYGRLPWENETTDEQETCRFDFVGDNRQKDKTTSLLDLIMPRGVLPRDTQLILKQFVPRPPMATVKATEAPPDAVQIAAYRFNPETKRREKYEDPVLVQWIQSERRAARELLAMLRLADSGKLTVTQKNRWPTPASIRAVTQNLDGGDYLLANLDAEVADDEDDDSWPEEDPGPIRAFAWPMLLQAGGLAHVRKQRMALTTEGRAALSQPHHETLRNLWRSWESNTLMDELRRIDAIKGQTGKGRRYLTDPIARREAIAAALAECPVGKWVTLDNFSIHMRAAGHDFEVTSNAWPLYLSEPRHGSLGYGGCHEWNILQFRYLLCVLMEYAATLGMIDIGCIPPARARYDYDRMWGTDDMIWFSRYDGLMYLRLNALGAYCLGLTEIYDAPPPEIRQVLAILPDLQVVVTADLPPADRMLLDTFALPVREDVWQLDRDSALAALAAGSTIAEITQFLEFASSEALPEAATELLADAGRRLTAFSDHGAARLIRCGSGALAALASQDPATHKTCYRLAEDVLVVPAKSEAAFLKGLRKLGYVVPGKTDKS